MTIGKSINKLRTNANLSQEQFAELFGVSRQSVQKWESGNSLPELDKLIKIAKHFDITIDSLVFDSDTRVTEELTGIKELKPKYENMHTWEAYYTNLEIEYKQSIEEGLDISQYEELFKTVAMLPRNDVKKKLGDILFEIVRDAKIVEGYEHDEPSTLKEIKELRNVNLQLPSLDKKCLKDKIHGAWMGRICGCLLGKTVEGIRTDELIPVLKKSNNYPMHRYINRSDIDFKMVENYRFRFEKRPFADEMDGMPVDDDTNYMVLAQKLISKHGKDFTDYDMSKTWLELQPKDAYCTAERVAFCNFVKGYEPPQSAIYKNPYREWIGAQIRGDYFGYISPGNPEFAAEMAFRDASISHIKNGIYGEMFIAAMLACAAVNDNIIDIINGGLAEIPQKSRLYEAVTKQLEDSNARIIITTIQKLDVFIRKNKTHDIYGKHVVLIFDECHRSQFGDMHLAIIKHFKKYHIFGFTGTPIFLVNASTGGNPNLKTTPQAFGDKLHTYTIVNAINDGNVLPFRIDYVNTVKTKENIKDSQVRAIDIEKAMSAPERIREIVKYTLENFDKKTMRNSFYSLKGQRVAGFNSIFAVSSIPVAMKYYNEFKRQLEEMHKKLNIATIFSFSANEDDPEDGLLEEGFDTDSLDQSSRDFLESAIADYNKTFNTNFDTSSDKFQNYYKDLSMKMKNREIDLLIVVNMFLTGFDATTLNTLWVDKNLKQHGLIQAFSRTNRILNSVKTYGNIVCFRDLEQEVVDAISLFGDKDAEGIVLLKNFDAYYYGYDEDGVHHAGFVELVDELTLRFPLGTEIIGESEQREFIRLFSSILRLRNILASFDDFDMTDKIPERDMQDYQSIYIDLWHELRPDDKADKENINDDIEFEIELIKQVEVNIDYILMLVAKYHESNCQDKEILANITKAVNASIQLRSKKDLIDSFVASVNADTNVDDDWKTFVREQKEKDISTLITEERLKDEEARKFIDNAFRDGLLRTTGTDIDKIMPPVSRFGGGNRAEKKNGIIAKLTVFFEKYLGLV